MGITVQFESYEEMVAFANKLVAGKVVPEQTTAPEPIKQKKPGKAPEEVLPEQEEKPAGEETKTYTLEEVRAALATLTRAGKQKQVKDLLTSFGASNLTGVDPKDYAALMEKAGAL